MFYAALFPPRLIVLLVSQVVVASLHRNVRSAIVFFF